MCRWLLYQGTEHPGPQPAEDCDCGQLPPGIWLPGMAAEHNLVAHILIDVMCHSQLFNGVPIESWFCDESDSELLTLIPFLESLLGQVQSCDYSVWSCDCLHFQDDVRPLIQDKYRMHELLPSD